MTHRHKNKERESSNSLLSQINKNVKHSQRLTDNFSKWELKYRKFFIFHNFYDFLVTSPHASSEKYKLSQRHLARNKLNSLILQNQRKKEQLKDLKLQLESLKLTNNLEQSFGVKHIHHTPKQKPKDTSDLLDLYTLALKKQEKIDSNLRRAKSAKKIQKIYVIPRCKCR